MSTPRRPSRGVRPGLASPPGPPSPDAVSGRIVAFSAAALGLLLLSTILGRQHLVVPGDPDRFAGLLSWADLERLRSYHELRTPRLRVVGEGEYLSEESYLTTHTVRRAPAPPSTPPGCGSRCRPGSPSRCARPTSCTRRWALSPPGTSASSTSGSDWTSTRPCDRGRCSGRTGTSTTCSSTSWPGPSGGGSSRAPHTR
jgi:hypothetical protein